MTGGNVLKMFYYVYDGDVYAIHVTYRIYSVALVSSSPLSLSLSRRCLDTNRNPGSSIIQCTPSTGDVELSLAKYE